MQQLLTKLATVKIIAGTLFKGLFNKEASSVDHALYITLVGLSCVEYLTEDEIRILRQYLLSVGQSSTLNRGSTKDVEELLKYRLKILESMNSLKDSLSEGVSEYEDYIATK